MKLSIFEVHHLRNMLKLNFLRLHRRFDDDVNKMTDLDLKPDFGKNEIT